MAVGVLGTWLREVELGIYLVYLGLMRSVCVVHSLFCAELLTAGCPGIQMTVRNTAVPTVQTHWVSGYEGEWARVGHGCAL